MKIFEVLDKPLPFRFSQRPSVFYITYATFETNPEIRYVVRFEPIGDGIFLLSFIQRTTEPHTFRTKTSSDITNTGNQYKVFSTIKNIIERFVDIVNSESNIKGFIFSAVEPSRVKLYDRFINLFSKSGFGFNYKRNINGETHYIVATSSENLKYLVKQLEDFHSQKS